MKNKNPFQLIISLYQKIKSLRKYKYKKQYLSINPLFIHIDSPMNIKALIIN
jgi:hypothetical protein